MTATHLIKCGNCKGAHDNVDDVRACYAAKGYYGTVDTSNRFPAAAVGPKGTSEQPATEKQRDYITRLASERKVSILPRSHNSDSDINPLGERVYADLATLTKKGASSLIEQLLAMPKPAPAKHADSAGQDDVSLEGMHKVGDDIFKVQRAVHGSGHLYAKRLVPGEGYGAKATFVYAPGILRTLNASTKMTLEEAKAFGALYGTCCVCGRTLTNEESIANGIGPVCGAKGGWAA